jgi:hypothetical protein
MMFRQWFNSSRNNEPIHLDRFPLENKEALIDFEDPELTPAVAVKKLKKSYPKMNYFFQGTKIVVGLGIAAGVGGFVYSIVKFAQSHYLAKIENLQNQFHTTETSYPYGSVNLGYPSNDPSRVGTNITCYEYLYSENMLYDTAALAFACHPDVVRCPLSTCSWIQVEEPQCKTVHLDLNSELCDRAKTLSIMSFTPIGVWGLICAFGSLLLMEAKENKSAKMGDIEDEKLITDIYELFRKLDTTHASLQLNEFKDYYIDNVTTFFTMKNDANYFQQIHSTPMLKAL